MARWWSLAPFRLRLLFRGAFLLLALATLALALYVLKEEKQLGYRSYQTSFHKTAEQIALRLRHPTGQLALLNPPAANTPVTPLHPLLLPFPAIDFDDQSKVQQAVEMSGCQVQYPAYGAVCVAIGSNPYAGGFIYVAGRFASAQLVPHARGDLDVTQAHRVRVTATVRGQTYRWLAPFELPDGRGTPDGDAALRGRLTGFIEDELAQPGARPVKDFRGWLWQNPQCVSEDATRPTTGCARRAFFSVRLPVAVLRDALFEKTRPVWPPADLARMQVRVEVLPPGQGVPLLDSNSSGATPPFSLADLTPLLLPGETLRIRKQGSAQNLLTLAGLDDKRGDTARWLGGVIRRLSVDGYDQPIQASEIINTPLGNYELQLTGDIGGINRSLAAVATRISWFVGAMLLAIALTWALIEIGIIRRITVLTRRAASVSRGVRGVGELEQLELGDLRGADELGVLAGALSDLLQRVKEDVQREQIRAEQEKDMWHAVGHEIMSPLQSLMALHGGAGDESARYIHRMQQAIRILYGSASPSEAFQATTLQVDSLELDAFLHHVAGNAPCVGINAVRYHGPGMAVQVRADEYSLEDVITHILRNAERYRLPDTPIDITLEATATAATVTIHNQGPNIPDTLINAVFEYGVSDQQDAAANGNRGQGLFVAKTYMAKMGGTIAAINTGDGVSMVLTLQRAI
ncbi:Signal transduction histidine kinase [Andreprevotia lacus DSM 23236]|jgi:signal transduction histidine kinase|uniref:histidine kinase n=1 Tax=Andreprevotia lacus DSM 23236 TaxID=1121001 RepID=A0A1W1XPD9_9NEIS|nr:HAMP domain-containing sensor histidine kinase [Andreprevotia lacus]SMC25734.1 Signal transduction histidine kinase [Andreprevotia lacus DSM 23236]